MLVGWPQTLVGVFAIDLRPVVGGECQGMPVTERDRAIALYTFLREFVKLRTKTIRNIARYEQDGEVIWAADIPREHGCHCIAWHRDDPDEPGGDGGDAPDEVWIEVRKPRLTPPPEPPESVHPWVRREQLDDSSLECPELLPALSGESDEDPLFGVNYFCRSASTIFAG